MWSIVLLRLSIPVSVNSMFSIMNLMPVQNGVRIMPSVSELPTLLNVQPEAVPAVPVLSDTVVNPAVPDTNTAVIETPAAPVNITQILFWIWIAGMIATFVYFLVINLCFAKRLKSDMIMYALPEKYQNMIGIRTRTYISSSVASPCVTGFFTHKIIFTPQAVSNDDYLRYTLKHELCHLRQRDNVIALIRNIVCAVYWFNPLVWVAALLSRKDCETACDAAVLGTLTPEEGFEYGKTLIALIQTGQKHSDILNTATTMTGGKKEMKERIQLIAKRPKALLITAVLLIIAVTATVVVACTSAQNADFARTLKEQEYGDEVCINDLTPFEWNVMYSFDYNAREDEICKCIGEKYAKIIDELDGNKFNVVFMNEGDVVFAGYGDPIQEGYLFDFGINTGKVVKLYAADRPKFKVADHKNGTKVFAYLKQERKYAEIINNYSGYTPAMSSIPGLPLEPDADIESMTVTCDRGELFLWTEEFGPRGQSIKVEEKRTVYWSPIDENHVDESINGANITVDAVLSDGSAVYQSLRIDKDNKGFYLLCDANAQNTSAQAPVYQRILKNSYGYTPMMSSIPGMRLEPNITGIASLRITCDEGRLCQFSSENQFNNEGQDITKIGEDDLYWSPFIDQHVESVKEATIKVYATLNDGTACTQTLHVKMDDQGYYMVDASENAARIPAPNKIIVKDGDKSMVLSVSDEYFDMFYQGLNERFPDEGKANIARLGVNQDDVALWKQEQSWVEFYYDKGGFAGKVLTMIYGESKDLSDNTRLLTFLTGQYNNLVFTYNQEYEPGPIFLNGSADDMMQVLRTAFSLHHNTTEWEEQNDGAKVRLYTVKETVTAGEGIEVRAEIMAGDKATDVDLAGYKTLNISRNGTPIMDEIGTDGQKNIMTLQPGQSVDFALTYVGFLEPGVYSLSGQFGKLTLPLIKVNVTKDQFQQTALSDEESAEQVLTSFLTEYYKGISLGGYQDAQGNNTTDLDKYVEWNDDTLLFLRNGEVYAERKRLGGYDEGSFMALDTQSVQKDGSYVYVRGYFRTTKMGTVITAALSSKKGEYKVSKLECPDSKEYLTAKGQVEQMQTNNPSMTLEDAVNAYYNNRIVGLMGYRVIDLNGKKDAPLINQIQPLIEKGCSLEHIGLYFESQGAKKLLVNLSGPIMDTGVIWEGIECVWNQNGKEEGWMNEIGKKDTYVLKKNDFDTLPVFLIDQGNVDYNTLTDYVNEFEDKALPCNIWVDTDTNQICLLTEVYVP